MGAYLPPITPSPIALLRPFRCNRGPLMNLARDRALSLYIAWDEATNHSLTLTEPLWITNILEYDATNIYLFISVTPDLAPVLANIETRAHMKGYTVRQFTCQSGWSAIIICDVGEMRRAQSILNGGREMMGVASITGQYLECRCIRCDQLIALSANRMWLLTTLIVFSFCRLVRNWIS